MGAKAPTPAPNRRADGTVDPSYKKPLAPPTLPTREDFANAIVLLETLIPDTVVKRLKRAIKLNVKHPLDVHFYVCFSVPDAAQPCDVVTEYLGPAIRQLAGTLSGIPTLAVRPLPACPEGLAVSCYTFPDSVLPLRFTTQYDMLREEHLITIDLFCRQVDMLIYFLRKKGTDQYYQRRGGRMNHCGPKRGACDPKWGPMATAACWTSIRGTRPVKGVEGEIVSFQLGEEFVT